MARRPLTSERALRRREQLLGIALDQFLARDYEDVSVDEIAEIAGVSHGLVFQYFGSKKDLYIASLEPLLGGFQEGARGAPAHLEPGGWVLIEVGDGQAGAAEALLAGAGLTDVGHREDLAGIARTVGARRG